MSVIDDYLKSVPTAQKAELERIRKLVIRMVPKTEETIGYGMPVFKVNSKYLMGMCPFKEHLSVFPGAAPIEALKNKLEGYKLSKGTIQFTLKKPLPDELLQDVVNACLEYNLR